MTDAEFKFAVMDLANSLPGLVAEVGGVWIRAYPSHDKAVQIPEFFQGGNMVRVALHFTSMLGIEHEPEYVFGVGSDNKAGIGKLCELIGLRYGRDRHPVVAIYDPVQSLWLNADGTPCKNQDDGPQYRAIEVDVRVGSVRV